MLLYLPRSFRWRLLREMLQLENKFSYREKQRSQFVFECVTTFDMAGNNTYVNLIAVELQEETFSVMFRLTFSQFQNIFPSFSVSCHVNALAKCIRSSDFPNFGINIWWDWDLSTSLRKINCILIYMQM